MRITDKGCKYHRKTADATQLRIPKAIDGFLKCGHRAPGARIETSEMPKFGHYRSSGGRMQTKVI